MANKTTDKNGNSSIQYVGKDGHRHSVYLGKLRDKDRAKVLDTWLGHVEELVAASKWGTSPKDATIKWVKQQLPRLQKKLFAQGLIPKLKTTNDTPLGPFIAEFIAGRTDLKRNTIENFRQLEQLIVEFFGADRLIATITPGDADEFRLWMTRRVKHVRRKKLTSKAKKKGQEESKPETLSDATIRRHCGRAKQLFRVAIRKRLIKRNPFADMKGVGVRSNRKRDYFVSREEAAKVLDACPNDQWRLIFALSRFGALRCPSEHLALRWSDFNWERGIFRVVASKTEHHEGEGERWVPIFPELRKYVDAVWATAPAGEAVITIRDDSGCNLRTQLLRIIKKAGLTAWPKLFQNLRASRATELHAEFPGHVATAWCGHSEKIARDHYLQVRDSDIAKAIEPKNLQNPTSAGIANTLSACRNDSHKLQKPAEKRGFREVCHAGEYPQEDSNL